MGFTKANITTGILLAAATLLFAHGNALEIVQRRLSPTFTLTLVHGDKDAMMTHMDALQYCRSLGRPGPNAEIAYSTPTSTTAAPSTGTTVTASTTNAPTTTGSSTTIKPNTNAAQTTSATATTITTTKTNHKVGHIVVEDDGTRYRSDLLSIHDGHMVNELMRWVLNIDKRQFWIGGVVKMLEHHFRDGHSNRHLLQLWTDRTPANFRFLHFDQPEMKTLADEDIACLSVDYASGKWGVHACDNKMYFVCETVDMGKETTSTTANPTTTTLSNTDTTKAAHTSTTVATTGTTKAPSSEQTTKTA